MSGEKLIIHGFHHELRITHVLESRLTTDPLIKQSLVANQPSQLNLHLSSNPLSCINSQSIVGVWLGTNNHLVTRGVLIKEHPLRNLRRLAQADGIFHDDLTRSTGARDDEKLLPSQVSKRRCEKVQGIEGPFG